MQILEMQLLKPFLRYPPSKKRKQPYQPDGSICCLHMERIKGLKK